MGLWLGRNRWERSTALAALQIVEVELGTMKVMNGNNSENGKPKSPSNPLQPPKINLRLKLLQNVLKAHPTLTREEAEEILRAYGAY